MTNEFRSRLGNLFDLRFWKNRASQPVFAMRISRRHKPAHERCFRARRYGNIGAAGNFHHAQGIGKRQLERNISRNRSDGLNLQLRRAHGEQQRQCIVHAGIGVDDHSEGTTGWLFGGTYSGMCLVGESACCQSGGRDGHKLAACNGKGFTIRIHIVALVQRLMTYKCGKEYFALSTH